MPIKIAVSLVAPLSLILLTSCGGTEPPFESESPEPPEEVEAPPAAEPEPEPEPEPEAKAEPEPAPPPEPEGPPKVRMETTQGTMVLELYPDRAPRTVENFLKYVEDEFYDGTIFHRVIPNFMIQGGGFTPSMKEKSTRAAIQNESENALSNLRYTIAMARTADPHSATAQFFINHVTNQMLDKSYARDGWGYCVFGKVVEGTEVLNSIARVQTGNKGMHQNVPTMPIVIRSVRRAG